MTVKLLTEQHLEFLSLKGACTGSSESTLSKCHIVGNHMRRLKWICCLSQKLQQQEMQFSAAFSEMQLKCLWDMAKKWFNWSQGFVDPKEGCLSCDYRESGRLVIVRSL